MTFVQKDTITILGKVIKIGESFEANFDVAKLHTSSSIDVPVIIERSKKPGPIVLFTAGIHGDEVNGVEIVRHLIANGINKPKSGTIICIPVINVFGFVNLKREFPDGRDLNRVFPGSNTGSLASRFAFHLMNEVIPHVDFCIDYHTGGAQRFNYSQIRIDEGCDETFELAKIFASPYIVYSKSPERTFRKSITKLGKKVLLFEGGKSLNLDKNVTKSGIQGAINVMHHIGLRNFISQISHEKSVVIKSSKWIRAKHSGMFRSSVSAGQKVERGIKLGSISDPFGDFESSFKNSQEGYILNSNHSPIVNQGDALFHIGFE